MAWRIEITERAARQIKKLDSSEAARIRTYLRDRIAPLDHPRRVGTPLRGSKLSNFWRYRVGDDDLLVLVIEVGHRRSIYRRP
ncbi:MAG: type II toxin-antitoxin system RelE/ParE family toxin [Alphaproteobacteria bacterium]|nr:type II toxin-antitoxin system RelE/ParE family toxin [Alphaproteobacteria bacterium]